MLADISKSEMCPWSNSEHSLQLHKQRKLCFVFFKMKKRTSAHTQKIDFCDGSIIHNNASSNVSVLLISQCIYNHIAKVF